MRETGKTIFYYTFLAIFLRGVIFNIQQDFELSFLIKMQIGETFIALACGVIAVIVYFLWSVASLYIRQRLQARQSL